jgi:predicted outer membrane repeat protein/parallel beta-helix repeat protein
MAVRVFVTLLTSLGMATATNANTLHVPSQYATIQAGINAAQNGDIVLVADGVYTGTGNKNLDFGGRLITVRSENGPEGCIIDCEGDPNDPHRGFYFHSGETDASVVDGFTVRNGFLDGSLPGNIRGGGIYCDEASPTITNCLFNMNQGGGVAFMGGDGPTITNCTFRDNSAYNGAGLWASSSSGTITITDCVFETNVASDSGGAIRVHGTSLYSVSLSRCTFIDNIGLGGTGGGAVRLSGWCGVLITECTFSGNATTNAGGALHVGTVYPVALSDCTFDENLAYESGGAIYCQSDTPARFVRCCFRGNMVGFENGGAIYYDGSLSYEILSSPVDRA